MSERCLRVAHVLVQPVLVYDDGKELTPGPGVQTIQAPLSALADVADKIRIDLAAMNAAPEKTPE